MISQPATDQITHEWGKLQDKYYQEIVQYQKELKENAQMLELSQNEMRKLAQKNASITAQLQQVQSHSEELPGAEIRRVYESALETQQRLFILRGQLEKLQSDQQHLKRNLEAIDGLYKLAESIHNRAGESSAATMNPGTVEMLVEAQEADRFRLSRQMHDGPAQSLSNFILQTDIAMRLFDIDISQAREELLQLKQSATSSFQQVRDFVFELRPMMLDDLGLIPTLKRYIDWLKEQSGLEIRFSFTGSDRRLEPYQEVMVFRAIQELLKNVSRHSQASEVKIHVDLSDLQARAVVEDNGKGFDTGMLPGHSGMGLKVIRERVESLGGTIDIDSSPDRGVRVSLQLPAEAAHRTSSATLGIE